MWWCFVALYRGCFDGFTDVGELSYDYNGCRNQTWNGKTRTWCLCDEDNCNQMSIEQLSEKYESHIEPKRISKDPYDYQGHMDYGSSYQYEDIKSYESDKSEKNFEYVDAPNRHLDLQQEPIQQTYLEPVKPTYIEPTPETVKENKAPEEYKVNPSHINAHEPYDVQFQYHQEQPQNVPPMREQVYFGQATDMFNDYPGSPQVNKVYPPREDLAMKYPESRSSYHGRSNYFDTATDHSEQTYDINAYSGKQYNGYQNNLIQEQYYPFPQYAVDPYHYVYEPSTEKNTPPPPTTTTTTSAPVVDRRSYGEEFEGKRKSKQKSELYVIHFPLPVTRKHFFNILKKLRSLC